MSTKKENAPFKADIVGSFLRPAVLKEARSKFSSGQISAEELKQVEDEEIIKLVNKQREAGLKVATDGEFRRSYWHLDFFWGFKGIAHTMQPQGYAFHDEETRADSARVCGKIAFNPQHPFLSHFSFLKSIVGENVVPRQTIPAPAQFYAELVRGNNQQAVAEFYPDKEELFHDICTAYHSTILAFYDLGCRNIQLDDCTWGMLGDRNFWKSMTNADYAIQDLQQDYLRLNNGAIENLPDDLTVNTHICRGNYHSTWAASGGYETVAEKLFGEENVKAYTIWNSIRSVLEVLNRCASSLITKR